MTVPVFSGRGWVEGGSPVREVTVTRDPGYGWPALGDAFVLCAVSEDSVPSLLRSSGGAWALLLSRDEPPSPTTRGGHLRVWLRHNTDPAPHHLDATVSLDPPGHAELILLDVSALLDANSPWAMSPPVMSPPVATESAE